MCMSNDQIQRHAYLIAAHNKPAQLMTLLALLDDGRNDIYIHIDKKATGFSEDALRASAPNSGVFFTERRDARWGSAVFIDVMVSLLALASGQTHAYYHMLSGVDLPLKSQREIHDFFDAVAGREFVSFDREPADPDVITKRIGFRHWTRPADPFLSKFDRKLAPLSIGLQKSLGLNRLKKTDVVFQKGGVWFSITHEFALYVLDQIPVFRPYFKNTFCADEIWLQTIMNQSPFMERRAFMGFGDELSATMRYVDWSGGGASPRTLTIDDYDTLIGSGMLFARKFDEAADAEIIRRISAKVRMGD